MAESCGNTLSTTIVEGYNATVGQRKLDFTLTLLTGNLTSYGTVNLVGQPVFAGYRL